MFKKIFLTLVMMSVFSAGFAKPASLYFYDNKLTDQNGKEFSLDDLKGHIVVATMFYASCNYSCPILISELKKMETSLKPEALKNVKILLISFDPENDTPAKLKEVFAQHKLDETRWKFASPPKDEVRTIASLLGISFRKSPDGEFNHNTVITILDEEGVPVLTQEGLSGAAKNLSEKIAGFFKETKK